MHIIKTKPASSHITGKPVITTLRRACAIAVCLLFSHPALADHDNQAPASQAEGTMIAAFSVWEPFAIEDEDGGIQGIDLMLLHEVAHRLGLELKSQPCPWRRCLKMLELGEIDVLTSFAYSDERAKFAQYIYPPYSRVNPVFYVNKQSPASITQYDDLRGLAIGSVVDSRYFEPFDSDPSLEKYEAGSEILILRMLEVGRIDTIVGSDANADYQIRKNNMQDAIIKAPFRSDVHNDIHMALSRKSSLIAQHDRIVKIMRDLHKEGFIQKIHEIYWPDVIPVDLPQLDEFPVTPPISSE